MYIYTYIDATVAHEIENNADVCMDMTEFTFSQSLQFFYAPESSNSISLYSMALY